MSAQPEIIIEPEDSEISRDDREFNATYVEVDSLGQYLKEISRTPLLGTREVEVEQFKRLEAGLYAGHILENQLDNDAEPGNDISELEIIRAEGEAARDLIFRGNLRLVVSIAKRHRRGDLDLLEIIQEGNEGLDHAINKFDYTQGNKFSTYATWWIRQRILRTMDELADVIRIPVNTNSEIYKMQKIAHSLAERLRIAPTTAQIALEMGIPEEKVKELQEFGAKPFSLEKLVGGDGGTELNDFIADTKMESPSDALLAKERKEMLYAALNLLPERECTVLKMRFGLDDGKPKKTDEISEFLSLTGQSVRNIEKRAIFKLRSPKYGGTLFDLLTDR